MTAPERRGPERPGPDYPPEWDSEYTPSYELACIDCGSSGSPCDCPTCPECGNTAGHCTCNLDDGDDRVNEAFEGWGPGL